VDNALSDQAYWDGVWRFSDAPQAVPEAPNEAEPTTKWRDRVIARHLGQTRRFLEVGAGGSPWPAFVTKKYDAEAWGIDFSPRGLELTAKAALANDQGISLVAGDVFDPTLLPSGYFDVVYSGGFLEHFPMSLPVLRRLGELVSRDGVVVTAVSNLCGINGKLQAIADADLDNRAVALSPASLDAAHAAAGLVAVERARYVGVIDFSAVNLSRLAVGAPSVLLRSVAYALEKLRRAGFWFDERTGWSGGRWLAPMVAGVYRAAR